MLVPEKTGFADATIKFDDLEFRLWFLTSKFRHFWRHHYFGTQGIIFIFACKTGYLIENLIIEVMNILKDQNLVNVPFLFLFDKSNTSMEELDMWENLRHQLSNGEYLYNIQYINFYNTKSMEEIQFGLDWLSSEMRALE
jgi:GTPase SAR1 family protein